MKYHKKGQIEAGPFLIILFFFLLIVAIALLTIETKNLESVRPQLAEDLMSQQAHAFLISLMRTKANDDQRFGSMNIADAIIMNDNENHPYDQFLLNALQSKVPSNVYLSLRIKYANGRILFIYNDPLQLYAQTSASVGSADIILPGRNGNIQVTITYTTAELYAARGLTVQNSQYQTLITTVKDEKSTITIQEKNLADQNKQMLNAMTHQPTQ